ncbi:hypothetical protein ACEPAF_6105 [Sanghuangporus sanghuang]
MVMFFGLCNAPAMFQGFMNDIFRELIHEGIIIIYLDDILIFSNDLEEHRSLVVKPLTMLTGKVEWKWGEEEQAAFKDLKRHLSSPPMLAIPNNKDPFYAEVDASDFATGGVLLQKQEGKWKVIAYRSSTFLEAKQNYEIYDKEMLAIVQALKEW